MIRLLFLATVLNKVTCTTGTSSDFVPPPPNEEWETAQCDAGAVREYSCPHAPAPSITGQNLVIHYVACLPSYVEIYFCCESFCNVFPEGSPRSMAYDFATKTWSQEPTCGIIPLKCPAVTIPSGSPIQVEYSDSGSEKTCGSIADFTCNNGATFIGSKRDVCGWGSDKQTGTPFAKWLSANDQESYSRTNPTPPGYCPATGGSCPRDNVIQCGTTKRTPSTVTWIPAEGWILDGPSSATCLADGTWSSPVPKCVECPCYQQNVENGVVNRVQVGNGCSYQYTVTCNSGYEAFGPVTYECGSTGMTPRFATRCIPEGSCGTGGGCMPLPVVDKSKVTRFLGTWSPAICVPQIFYECDPGCTLEGSSPARCMYRGGKVVLPFESPSCVC